jgi:hypothetical protein
MGRGGRSLSRSAIQKARNQTGDTSMAEEILIINGRIITNHNQTIVRPRIILNHNQTILRPRIIMNHNQTIVRR